MAEASSATSTPEAGSRLSGRAGNAVRQLTVRGGMSRAISLVGGLALAGLLGPRGFGPFAVGLAMLSVLQALGAGGMAALLIRRRELPTAEERHAVFTFQLLLGLALAGLGAAVALTSSDHTTRAIALVLLGAPFSAFKVLPVVLLERELEYGRITAIDLVELTTLYVVAIPLVAIGSGLDALPGAGVASAVAAAIAASRVQRTGARPTARLGPAAALWRFGLLFQGAQLLSIVRDFGLNLILLAAAGPVVAGTWAFAQRLLVVPLTAFQALWRVGFVVFSRLEGDAAGTRDAAERIMRSTAIAACTSLALVAGPGPIVVRVVLGEQWADVQPATVLAAAGWMVAAPISGALLGLLQAHHRLRAPVLTTVLQIVVLWAAAPTLAPAFGTWTVGLGWLGALLVDAVVFLVAARGIVRLDLAPLAVATAVAAAAIGAAMLADAAIDGLAGALAACLATAVVLGVGLRTLLADDVAAVVATLRPGRRPAD